jgi:tetratricopeptide (TPR) repeat protein
MNKTEELRQITGEHANRRTNFAQFILPLSPENEEILARLIRVLDYAEGFTLLFARCNVPVLRRRLIDLAEEELHKLGIRVLKKEFDAPVQQLRDVLREWLTAELPPFNLTQITPLPIDLPPVLNEPKPTYSTEPKIVLFVSGLEHSIPYDNPNARLLAELNLGREFFQFDTPYPLLIWLPDYAITAVVRHAPDFWSWNSGIFEFVSEKTAHKLTWERFIEPESSAFSVGNMNLEQKVRRRRLLENLLDDTNISPEGEIDVSERTEILFQLGMVTYALGDWQRAVYYYQQALTFQEQMRNKGKIATLLNNIGRVYDENGDRKNALYYYERALDAALEVDNTLTRAAALHNIGGVYSNLGDVEQALDYYEQALALWRKLEHSNLAATLNDIGVIYKDLGEKSKALECFAEALQLSERVGDRINIAKLLNNMGGVLQNLDNKQQALICYMEALDIWKSINHSNGQAATLLNIGSIYQELGDNERAIDFYQQSLVYYRELANKQGEATARRNIQQLTDDLGR